MQLHDVVDTLYLGTPLRDANSAVILLHGRGSSATDIAGLAGVLPPDGVSFLAPSAAGNQWYPRRFLEPWAENEPWLSSALGVVGQLVKEVEAAGIEAERLGLIGFSQGACLALEFVARMPRRYALVGGLSGALIGPLDTPARRGDLAGTPVLLGCAERDAHIPLEYVEKTAAEFGAMGAAVTKQVFPGGAHLVFPEEIEWLRERLASGH